MYIYIYITKKVFFFFHLFTTKFFRSQNYFKSFINFCNDSIFIKIYKEIDCHLMKSNIFFVALIIRGK